MTPKPRCSVATCDLEAFARGMCQRHNQNQHRYGHAIPIKEWPLNDRLDLIGWDITPTGCWEWRGARNQNGYGLFNHQRVHRLMYARHNDGATPPVVRHTCDNPPCVNPAHLLAGTPADNRRDMVERGRRRRDLCPAGHDRTAPGVTRTTARGEVLCIPCARERSRRWEAAQRKAIG